jgi:3-oxoacyl-[acyl-carrier-protein] synthase II
MNQLLDARGRPRVVITGMGMVSPVGLSVDESWKNALIGQSGIGPVTQFDASDLPCRIAGEVKGFEPRDYIEYKEIRRMSRVSQLATAAGRMAMEDAGLTGEEEDRERIGVVVGTGMGGLETAYENMRIFRQKGLSRLSPFSLPMVLPSMPTHHLSLISKALGPISTVVAACATGTQSIGEAAEFIRRNAADVVLSGGAEGLIHVSSMASFAAMRALSTSHNDDPEKASRPFDMDRDGFILSEGAGVVVLERLERALARGAHIYGEVLGHASSSDAFHVAAPDPEGAGAIRAMRWAVEDAGLALDEIDYINAHGTSTQLNDATETLAIKKLFGEQAYNIPVSSTKSVTGHAMGGAGAIEAIFCVRALQEGIIPPTWNYETADPDCDLDYVPNEPRQAPLKTAMSNSFGLGGQNACLVLGKYEAGASSSSE